MNKVNDNQKKFLLENFFRNEDYAGWKSIAENLIDKGACLVAGTENIWIGGIGNFIDVSEAKNAVGCSMYKFDLNNFLISQWFKDIKDQQVSVLSNKKKEVTQELEDILKM